MLSKISFFIHLKPPVLSKFLILVHMSPKVR